MSWLRTDDDMLDHEKWRRAIRTGGDGVLLMWWRFAAWCSRRLTDGRVPSDMVDELAEIDGSKTRSKALRALVDARLLAWHDPAEDSTEVRRGLVEPAPRQRRDGDELVIVGYLARNPSKAKVLQELDRKAKAQRDYELRKRADASVSHQDPIRVRPDRSDPENVPPRPLSSPISIVVEHEPPEVSPLVIKAIPPDFELDDELRSDAIAAGVHPAAVDDRLADLKLGPIGGRRGIFARDLRDYIRRQFPKWRTWGETQRANDLDRAPARAGPNSRLHKQADRVRMLREQEAEEERRGAAGGVSS